MDGKNIHGIMSQLKSIAEGINNHWAVWVSLAGVIMVGVAGIFQDRIRYWLCKPKLRVTFKESSIITDRNYGNIPHYNFAFKIENTGKSTLENAEALVSDIDGNRGEKVNPVEFNLTWKDHGGTTIPRIPSNTYKFLILEIFLNHLYCLKVVFAIFLHRLRLSLDLQIQGLF